MRRGATQTPAQPRAPRAQYVAVEYQRNGVWHECSVTVAQLWLLVRCAEVTQLETL